MKFLVDAVFPATLTTDAPAGIDFVRWTDSAEQDSELVRYAATKSFRGVIFFDRNSLAQPGLRQLAEELGVALIAVDAPDPIYARERLLHNAERLRSILTDTQFVLILASEVRKFEPPLLTDST